MTREDIISYLEPFWSRTLSFMKEALRSDVPLLDSVNESVAGASGKMLRPMMSLLVARAIGTPNDDSCRYASACELLHNATLMHDDVADESSRRRGRPTVSALLGPSAAVLVGDFWLSKAVELARNDRKKQKMRVWLSPDHDWYPVQILFDEEGGLKLMQTIRNIAPLQ